MLVSYPEDGQALELEDGQELEEDSILELVEVSTQELVEDSTQELVEDGLVLVEDSQEVFLELADSTQEVEPHPRVSTPEEAEEEEELPLPEFLPPGLGLEQSQ